MVVKPVGGTDRKIKRRRLTTDSSARSSSLPPPADPVRSATEAILEDERLLADIQAETQAQGEADAEMKGMDEPVQSSAAPSAPLTAEAMEVTCRCAWSSYSV